MRIVFVLALAVAAVGLIACGSGGEETRSADAGSKTTSEQASTAQTQTAQVTEEVNPIVERSISKDPGPADELVTIKTNMAKPY